MINSSVNVWAQQLTGDGASSGFFDILGEGRAGRPATTKYMSQVTKGGVHLAAQLSPLFRGKCAPETLEIIGHIHLTEWTFTVNTIDGHLWTVYTMDN